MSLNIKIKENEKIAYELRVVKIITNFMNISHHLIGP